MGPWIRVYECQDARWVIAVRLWRTWHMLVLDASWSRAEGAINGLLSRVPGKRTQQERPKGQPP